MKYILVCIVSLTLIACQPSYTKKEQLLLKVDPSLMVKPSPLIKLKELK